ncbi:MAG: citrate synthase, partial [Clostridia bacterium]
MTNFEQFNNKVKGKIEELSKLAETSDYIDSSVYEKYNVKRGLRDMDGNGVLCGLTEISEIISATIDADGNKVACDGELYYRGYQIDDICEGFLADKRFGYEEVSYLLLFGKLPTQDELKEFVAILAGLRRLPDSFVRDVIMKAPSHDMMNVLARTVLTLYSYDEKADDITIPNVLRQVLQLIAQFPLLSVYGYKIYMHYVENKSLVIHNPQENLGTAENLLYILRDNSQYTQLEAKVLDLCLVLHAEHGGGNNSTFTTHVVTSSGTDTYSAVAASLGSLKGPRHGGANIKVVKMFADLKENVKDYSEPELRDYLAKLLAKEAFDKSGLIYGLGHAVYSISDPRARILKVYAKQLAEEKGLEKEYQLYADVERIAAELICE